MPLFFLVKGKKSRTSRGVGAAGALKGPFGSAVLVGSEDAVDPGGVYFMVLVIRFCDMGYALIIVSFLL
jgi:hypothetical protein